MKVESLKTVQSLNKLVLDAKKDDGASVAVGYNSKVAQWLHQMRNPLTLAQGKARRSGIGHYWGPSDHGPGFLLDPSRKHAKEIADIVFKAYKGGAGLLQALYLGGFLVQRKSMTQVPVEHGHLRQSAFTEKE